MPPAGWLLIAATALILVASWCAAAHDAMVRADPDGFETYGGLLTLIRVSAEVSAAVLVTLAFAHWLGGGWQVFLPAAGALLVATYVLIGVAPRPLGKQRAEKTAATAARLLRPLRRALGPLPVLLDKLTGVLPLGAHGADPEFGGRPEVRSLVDYIEGQAEIEPGERDMVRSVFELGDTIVREVMVPRTDMVFIERDKTLDQALSLALRSGFSRIPVVGESIDDVVGIAYLKDVVAWEQEHPDADNTLSERIEKVMRPATYVPDSKPVDELLRQMQSMRIHVAIVIDEYGGTAGLVTIEDILEEIVGEIADEYDTERAPVEWLAPGHRPGHGAAAGDRARGAVRGHGGRGGRGNRRRPACPRARPGADRGRRSHRGRPPPHRREPGGPPQQAGHGACPACRCGIRIIPNGPVSSPLPPSLHSSG